MFVGEGQVASGVPFPVTPPPNLLLDSVEKELEERRIAAWV